MILLKPEAVGAVLMVPITIARKLCGWFARTHCGKRVASRWIGHHAMALVGFTKRSSKVVIQLIKRESEQISRIAKQGSKRTARAAKHLVRRPSFKHNATSEPEGSDSGAVTNGTCVRPMLDQSDAAKMIQALWRHRNSRVQAAHHNIAILRRNLLLFVSTAKHLGREDFLLIFSYAVYR
jgi:hypothetical protein